MNFLKLKKRIKELEMLNDDLSCSNFKLVKENKKLNKEIKCLKEPKSVINISINKEDIKNAAKQIVKELNKEKEHKCTPECFYKHVIKAIQNDYDSCPVVFKATFLTYWYDNLSAYYPWLESLYIIDGKIYFKSK